MVGANNSPFGKVFMVYNDTYSSPYYWVARWESKYHVFVLDDNHVLLNLLSNTTFSKDKFCA
jgi:hypothetical protein